MFCHHGPPPCFGTLCQFCSKKWPQVAWTTVSKSPSMACEWRENPVYGVVECRVGSGGVDRLAMLLGCWYRHIFLKHTFWRFELNIRVYTYRYNIYTIFFLRVTIRRPWIQWCIPYFLHLVFAQRAHFYGISRAQLARGCWDLVKSQEVFHHGHIFSNERLASLDASPRRCKPYNLCDLWLHDLSIISLFSNFGQGHVLQKIPRFFVKLVITWWMARAWCGNSANSLGGRKGAVPSGGLYQCSGLCSPPCGLMLRRWKGLALLNNGSLQITVFQIGGQGSQLPQQNWLARTTWIYGCLVQVFFQPSDPQIFLDSSVWPPTSVQVTV